VHVDATFGERQGDPPGSNRECKYWSRAGELGEEGDCCLRVDRDPLDPLVVDFREAVAIG
jgi:hypothetical protein